MKLSNIGSECSKEIEPVNGKKSRQGFCPCLDFELQIESPN
jgi:hypothetical protein